jgi:hypothetical protein
MTLKTTMVSILLLVATATLLDSGAWAQANPQTWEWRPESRASQPHRFFDKENSRLFVVNAVSQAIALVAIQSRGPGMESRGRTLDGFEKHFESYGYAWGASYRFGGGIGLNMLSTLVFHEPGHHKLERWVPLVAIGHAEMSTVYALTGSRQSNHGGW